MTSLFFTEYEGNVDLHNRMRANPWQSPFVGANPMDYLERTHLPMERGAISTGGSQGEASTPNILSNPSEGFGPMSGLQYGRGKGPVIPPSKVNTLEMVAFYGLAAVALYYIFKKV
jgi:hypothetical protein